MYLCEKCTTQRTHTQKRRYWAIYLKLMEHFIRKYACTFTLVICDEAAAAKNEVTYTMCCGLLTTSSYIESIVSFTINKSTVHNGKYSSSKTEHCNTQQYNIYFCVIYLINSQLYYLENKVK